MEVHKMSHPQMRRIQNIHFVGIGGSGMSGIAEVLLNQGYSISGSDIAINPSIISLRSLGASIFIGHDKVNISSADVVVKSSAVDFENEEIKEAFKSNIPVIRRAQMLAELMRFRHGIAVAGTHGKTTTTSILASILAEDQKDPTFIIGGKVNSLGTSAKLGESHYLVAEADESDASFVHLQPLVAVITNIDFDHMETYGHDIEKLKSTYVSFLHNLPFHGLAVVCADDTNIESILQRISRPCITYGFSEKADVQITEFKSSQNKSEFKINNKSQNKSLSIKLNMPGKHNALNVAAAATVALDEGTSCNVIETALKNFSGVSRRFEEIISVKKPGCEITYVDDYGHHPSEIRATLDAARLGWPNRKIILIFQPHRFSRTRDLYSDFVDVLSNVDFLILMNIYSAGESSIPEVNSKNLSNDISRNCNSESHNLNDPDLIVKKLVGSLSNNDFIITQGAGDISNLAPLIKSALMDYAND